MNLYEILVASATQGLRLQCPTGAMPAGHNGPYQDPETPVRNTAHWLILFLKAFQISGKPELEGAARACLRYLMSREARPMGAAFWHRKNPDKDFSNGVMGQAWCIEALVVAHGHFQDESILQLAEEVFLLHPYHRVRQGWKIVNVDGSLRGFDPTFNHNLWFAAAGAMLAASGRSAVVEPVTSFLASIGENLQLYGDGVIRHLPLFYLRKSLPSKVKALAIYLKDVVRQQRYYYLKSVGYHGFNLYALGLIHRAQPELPFFASQKFRRALGVLSNAAFKEQVADSKYGYPYNPPGFECAFALEEFEQENAAGWWVDEQLGRTFDPSKQLLTAGKPSDPNTAAARLYEATRLRDRKVGIQSLAS